MEDENGARDLGPAQDPVQAVPAPPGVQPGRPGADPGRPLLIPPPVTGESRVDAALGLLDDLTELPIAEHPAVFERVHAELGEVLGELGSGSPGGPAGRDGN